MGYVDRSRPSGMAYRVFRHVDGRIGRNFRSPRWWRRPDLPASRERNRAVGITYGKTLRAFLVSFALSAGRRREDVEEPRQLLHAARFGAEGTQAIVDPLSARLGSLSQPVELYL